jgi:hypothetical protein
MAMPALYQHGIAGTRVLSCPAPDMDLAAVGLVTLGAVVLFVTGRH